jgi:hypothetical protein
LNEPRHHPAGLFFHGDSDDAAGMPPIDLLAHYEAGHAVMAHRFGLIVATVTIDPRTEDGATTLAQDQKPSDLQKALILLAGGRAEKILDPASVGHRTAAARDQCQFNKVVIERLRKKLWRRAVEYVDRLEERIDQRLADRCERMLREDWPAVSRLASVLAERHALGAAEVSKLLTA